MHSARAIAANQLLRSNAFVDHEHKRPGARVSWEVPELARLSTRPCTVPTARTAALSVCGAEHVHELLPIPLLRAKLLDDTVRVVVKSMWKRVAHVER